MEVGEVGEGEGGVGGCKGGCWVVCGMYWDKKVRGWGFIGWGLW